MIGLVMTQTALIFGVTGQDGSYLSRLLLSKGYQVFGVARRTSVDNRIRLPLNDDMFSLLEGDLSDGGSIWHAIQTTQPDEIYNLGAQAHVHASFAEPEYTGNVNALGVVRILEALRTLDPMRNIKFYQASTSEMFGQGSADGAPLNENSPMLPVSPYGAAKLYAYHMVKIYRQAYGLYACNGILFNHESPMRKGDFVTAKIAGYAAQLKMRGWQGHTLSLGNLDACRDWGHAGDYAEGMWRMMQQAVPDDYVLATGEARSVREFAEAAFQAIGKTVAWSGKGIDEIGIDEQDNVVVRIDEGLFRPIDVPHLLGDSAKARAALGWRPQTSFDGMVAEMVAACAA